MLTRSYEVKFAKHRCEITCTIIKRGPKSTSVLTSTNRSHTSTDLACLPSRSGNLPSKIQSLSKHALKMTNETCVEGPKTGGCCSGKKRSADKTVDPAKPTLEIEPIVKVQAEEAESAGCRCCSRETDPEPANDGRLPYSTICANNAAIQDDGRPQPVVLNWRCACGSFRGCCWGTCYPGCKCTF